MLNAYIDPKEAGFEYIVGKDRQVDAVIGCFETRLPYRTGGFNRQPTWWIELIGYLNGKAGPRLG